MPKDLPSSSGRSKFFMDQAKIAGWPIERDSKSIREGLHGLPGPIQEIGGGFGARPGKRREASMGKVYAEE